MTLGFLTHSLFLISAVGLTFFWVNDPTLSLYTLQLIAVFILLYFLSNWLNRRKDTQGVKALPPLRWNTSVIFTMVVMLLVVSTGGLISPLFFLIYFLLFGLSLTLEPPVTIILTTCLIIFFYINSPNATFDNLLPLMSLILITPLALFFGRQYLQLMQQKGEIKILKIKEQVAKHNITEEETNTLLWLSLNFKNGIVKIIDSLSQVLAKPGLSFNQKNHLQIALHNSQKLLQTGKILEEKIDKQTD